MKLGIMQPYFFPYLGYWQLMNAVDHYVIYDDVNFIKGGRINRNAVLMNGAPSNINLILNGASPNKLINEVQVKNDPLPKTKLIKTLEACYGRAPYFKQVMPLLEEVILQDEESLPKYLRRSFEVVGGYLGIQTNLVMSSELDKDCSLKGYKKVIEICKLFGATEYYNSVNGIPLYEPHREEFEQEGIQLCFPKMRDIHYPQYKGEFVPNLSIIDVMMFNSQDACKDLLLEYDLVKE